MSPGHLIIVPIVLPLVAGALLLLIDERQRRTKTALALATTALLLVTTILLVRLADTATGVTTYRVGNWETPIGIVLVLDRLSALMVLLVALLAAPALMFASARWHRVGPHFYSLFLFLLVGVNGAFLTGDLFNLFVFLEVLLAASYGLAMHGSGNRRVRAGLHYIAVNVTGASLLLIGISMLYGVTGTLNIADIAGRVPELTGTNRALAEAGAGILFIALLLKAGMWPLCFWLVPTYTAASAPVAAAFAIMTKVGIYAVVRLWVPLFGAEFADAGIDAGWLFAGGVLTLGFGTIGVLSAQALGPLAGYSVIISAGTLLATAGTGNGPAMSGALFYLVSSSLGIAALFLVIELIERGRDPDADLLGVTRESFADDDSDDDAHDVEIGLAIPGSLAFVGLAFTGCALLLAGLPPLSGFLAKFAIFTALFSGPAIPAASWAVVALLIGSGFITLIAASRVGMRVLWAETERTPPRVVLLEAVPVVFLLLLCCGLTVGAGRVMRYTDATAEALQAPYTYIDGGMNDAQGSQAAEAVAQ